MGKKTKICPNCGAELQEKTRILVAMWVILMLIITISTGGVATPVTAPLALGAWYAWGEYYKCPVCKLRMNQ
jgi:hypothetical protein